MEWISVKERLPEDTWETVIIYGGINVEPAIYNSRGQFLEIDPGHEYGRDEVKGVTHWMPLPVAPEDE